MSGDQGGYYAVPPRPNHLPGKYIENISCHCINVVTQHPADITHFVYVGGR